MNQATGRVADATGNWVDTIAPAWVRPYLRLTRLDRPIGWWLLLLPCWWSAALAAIAAGRWGPDLWHVFLFLVGAIVMRGAGCTWNDLMDCDIDARVERTRSRPIPSGQVSVRAAVVFLVVQALVGLLVLVQFNNFSIVLGVASLAVVFVYPLMKRVTYWPQVFLGLAFSWGALMGWAALFGRLDLPAYLLYAGAIAWVIHYDTIYAHQDAEDDALLGLKSTALLFGKRTKPALLLFSLLSVALIGLAGWTAGAGVVFAIGLAAFAAHLAWQIRTIDIADSALCLRLFKSNRDAGLLLFGAMIFDATLRYLVSLRAMISRSPR
jgi:4-hydroxybenzoate polyprenyltransferase